MYIQFDYNLLGKNLNFNDNILQQCLTHKCIFLHKSLHTQFIPNNHSKLSVFLRNVKMFKLSKEIFVNLRVIFNQSKSRFIESLVYIISTIYNKSNFKFVNIYDICIHKIRLCVCS